VTIIHSSKFKTKLLGINIFYNVLKLWKYVENTRMPLYIKITELSRVYTKVIALPYVDVAEPLRIIIRKKTLER